jgi:hypothetical protein
LLASSGSGVHFASYFVSCKSQEFCTAGFVYEILFLEYEDFVCLHLVVVEFTLHHILSAVITRILLKFI